MMSERPPGMNDAQFVILNTKLDGIHALLDEKLTHLEEKVDYNRRNADMASEAAERRFEKLEERTTLLEHARIRYAALIMGGAAALTTLMNGVAWFIEHGSK